MNSKMLLAFVGGLIVASGVTYIAMKRNSAGPAETALANMPAPVAAPVQAPPAKIETAEPAPDLPDVKVPAEMKKPSPAVSHPARAAKPAPKTKVPDPVTQSETPTPAPAPVDQASAPTPAPAPAEVAKVEPPKYEPPPPPQPHTVTIPAGTMLTVRLGETLTTERNQPGDQFSAVLDQPLVVDGFVIAERSSRAQGRIVELERSGKVRGVARLAVELTQIKTSDGQNVRVNTSAFNKQADTSRRKDAAKVGIGAALGAAIGAMAGGGKGAAIGAGVGGAAGAGDVAMTRGAAAELRVETKIAFRLAEAVTVTEKLH